MEPGPSRASLAQIAARFKTVITVFTAVGNGYELVIPADPRRWAVRFHFTGVGVGAQPLLPGQLSTPMVTGINEGNSQEYLFRDWPAAVTGEWYAAPGAGVQILVVENLYIGD